MMITVKDVFMELKKNKKLISQLKKHNISLELIDDILNEKYNKIIITSVNRLKVIGRKIVYEVYKGYFRRLISRVVEAKILEAYNRLKRKMKIKML